jgi:hypothetical protein
MAKGFSPAFDQPHVDALERQVADLQGGLWGVQSVLDDARRQLSKCCIIFLGPAIWGVTPVPGETDWQRVLRFAWDYWCVDMVKADLVQAHPVQRGKSLLTKFGNLFKGFQKILDWKPEYLGRPEIHAKLLLVSKTDRRMDFVAWRMKKQGEILDFRFDPVSGKPKVRFPTGNLWTFSDVPALLLVTSETTRNKIQAMDKKLRD